MNDKYYAAADRTHLIGNKAKSHKALTALFFLTQRRETERERGCAPTVSYEAAFKLLLCRRIIYLVFYSWEDAVDSISSHCLSTTGFH